MQWEKVKINKGEILQVDELVKSLSAKFQKKYGRKYNGDYYTKLFLLKNLPCTPTKEHITKIENQEAWTAIATKNNSIFFIGASIKSHGKSTWRERDMTNDKLLFIEKVFNTNIKERTMSLDKVFLDSSSNELKSDVAEDDEYGDIENYQDSEEDTDNQEEVIGEEEEPPPPPPKKSQTKKAPPPKKKKQLMMLGGMVGFLVLLFLVFVIFVASGTPNEKKSETSTTAPTTAFTTPTVTQKVEKEAKPQEQETFNFPKLEEPNQRKEVFEVDLDSRLSKILDEPTEEPTASTTVTTPTVTQKVETEVTESSLFTTPTPHSELEIVENDVNKLKNDVRILQTDVKVLQSDVKEIKTDVRQIKEEIKSLTSTPLPSKKADKQTLLSYDELISAVSACQSDGVVMTCEDSKIYKPGDNFYGYRIEQVHPVFVKLVNQDSLYLMYFNR